MPAPCVGCNPNAYNDNPEVGKAYKLKNNSLGRKRQEILQKRWLLRR